MDLLPAAQCQRFALRFRECLPPQHAHAMLLGGAKAGLGAARLGRQNLRDLAFDARESRVGGEPVVGRQGRLVLLLLRGAAQLGHPHHVELVEITRHDRDEAEPFAQRSVPVLRERQHPTLEGEEAELRAEHFGQGTR